MRVSALILFLINVLVHKRLALWGGGCLLQFYEISKQRARLFDYNRRI